LVKVAPSILAADFTALGREVGKVSNADILHVDIMDGHFVPNISVGLPVIEALHSCADMDLEVHLMAQEPHYLLEMLKNAGCRRVCVHAEAVQQLHRCLQQIRQMGLIPGVALNPATPLSQLEYVLDDTGFVLIMTVNPGFGGQRFIPAMLAKIKDMRAMVDQRRASVEIEVDGGIDAESGAACVRAGADILVAGSYIFKADDPREAVARLRNTATVNIDDNCCCPAITDSARHE